MGFPHVRPKSREQEWLDSERQAGRNPDTGIGIAHLSDVRDPRNEEGTSANGVGGDFTANLPSMIVDTPQAVRPDYSQYDDKTQYYGKKADRRMAESAARKQELARTLREIELKAKEMDPGHISTAGFASAGPASMVIEQANRLKFNKMLDESKKHAMAAHEAKYGLPPSSDWSAGMTGFSGIRPFG